MRARIQIVAVVLASASVGACSLSGLTFDLGSGGAGGSATTTTSSSGGGIGGSGGVSASSSASTGMDPPAVCGDGHLDPDEQCDDGNLVALDGCSPACTTDVLETCPGALVPLTPAGLKIMGTLVGTKQDLKPSCGTDKADVVYAVVPSVGGTLSISTNGGGLNQTTVSVRSSCADGPITELACNQTSVNALQIWAHAGVTYWVVVSGQQAAFTLDLKLLPCGNGVVEGLEECDDPQNPACVGCLSCVGNGEVFDPVSRHCYLVQQGAQKGWPGARSSCVAWGGDLVAASSLAELDFVAKKISKAVWTGGHAVTSNCLFSWSNGEPWSARWMSGEPSDSNGVEDCVYLNPNGNALVDYFCTANIGYVCERSPVGSCGDGIVQPGEECDDAVMAQHFDCAGCKLTCKAGEFEDPATRHCYRVVPDPLGQTAAASACATLGATLANINTPEENALIQAHVTAQAWIGLTPSGNWSDTDPVCFENIPNGGLPGCAVILPDGTWKAAACASTQASVCERQN
jgi:cysteine-rich repeat protein